MAVGDILRTFAASSDLDVTNLHSLPTSSTFVAVWESAVIDNTTTKYPDFRLTGKITVAAASLAAGQIRVFVVGPLDDSTWPDVLDGTQSTETITDTEMRDAICRLAASTDTDTTNSDVYPWDCPSVARVFDDNMPKKFLVLIAHSTGQNLAASGNQVTITGSHDHVEQS